MNERLKLLRDKLDLSRAAFGRRIGVSGDVINNLERGRVEIKEHILKLIRAEFNVNEEWILNGTEPMFIEPDTFNLDSFAKSHGMSDFELEILKTYFELDVDTRKMLVDYFRNKLAISVKTTEENSATAETVEEAEAAYIKSRLNAVPNKGLPVSSLKHGTKKKASNE